MTIGIASPTPAGIPGFNQAGMYVRAGIGGGSINAQPLPGWYNILRDVFNANDSVSLPPANCGGVEVVVWNYSNELDPISGAALGVPNTVVVFGNTNPFGIEDMIDDGSGTPGTSGVAIAPGEVALFWATRPQAGFTNAWLPGRWQYKLLA